jgi:hypothetical protein
MKLLRRFSFFMLASLGLIVISCHKPDKQVFVPQMNYSYFPLKEGITRIYKADSFLYLTTRQQINFQLKEVITGTYVNNIGERVYRIERFTRADSTASWKPLDVLTARRNEHEALLTLGNNTIQKLMFPFATSAHWDFNKYNTADSLHSYEAGYSELNTPFTIGSTRYDSTALVTYIQDTSSIITKYHYTERYAAGVGLIRADDKHMDLQPPKKPGDPWDTSGYIYHQELTEFTK